MYYYAEQIASYVANLSFEQLPTNVVRKTKDIIIDWLAVCVAGKETEPYKIIGRTFGIHPIKSCQKSLEHTQPVTNTNLIDVARYAMAEGTAAHALDFDDTVLTAMLHPSASIVSTAMALGKELRIDGKKLIEAVVAGYDVVVRLGEAINSPPSMAHHRRGFHPTATCGVFGAAITAAKLLHLNALQITNAMGIAGSFASGILEFFNEGAMTKRMHPGKAAHDGIVASLLARNGFTGPRSVLEGRDGFFRAYSDELNDEKVTSYLGSRYAINDSSLKIYACCHHIHSSITGLQQIMRASGLKADQIGNIIVELPAMASYQVAEPIEQKRNPKNLLEAQMSLPFCLSVSAICGKLLPNDIIKGLNDHEVKGLCNKITVIPTNRMDLLFAKGFMPASIEVVTKEGAIYSQQVDYPPGVPQRPLTYAQVKEKYMLLTVAIKNQLDIFELIDKLEYIPDISSIVNYNYTVNSKVLGLVDYGST